MQPLVARYESPSAALDLESARAAVLDALPRLRALRALDDLRFLLSSVQNAGAGFAIRGLAQELRADIDGYATVQAVCPGPAPEAAQPDRERDGSVSLTARIHDAALQPVVFGHADDCRISQLPSSALPDWLSATSEPLRGRLNGPLAVHLGSALVLGRQTRLTPLVRVDGTLEIEGLPSLRGFDFRLPAAGVLELDIELGTENVVLVLEQDRLRVRERRGTWSCEAAGEATCWAEF